MKQDKQPVITTVSAIGELETFLRREERSANTVAKYIRDLRALFSYLDGREMDKGSLLSWKGYLVESYTPANINSMLAVVNTLLDFAGLTGWKIKPLKIQ